MRHIAARRYRALPTSNKSKLFQAAPRVGEKNTRSDTTTSLHFQGSASCGLPAALSNPPGPINSARAAVRKRGRGGSRAQLIGNPELANHEQSFEPRPSLKTLSDALKQQRVTPVHRLVDAKRQRRYRRSTAWTHAHTDTWHTPSRPQNRLLPPPLPRWQNKLCTAQPQKYVWIENCFTCRYTPP